MLAVGETSNEYLGQQTCGATKIRLLPQNLINQIAAGEVIERPASVVKELVENALDAGADDLEVQVTGGGKSLILVRDNGRGMSPDDMKLAMQRHATSKLPGDDLSHILTFGFRGEALPSIASIAKVRITSRIKGSDSAYVLKANGGQIAEPQPAAGDFGTEIEVADLFYATPARLKFLKSDRAENSAVYETMEKLAMSREDVAFKLYIDGKLKLSLKSAISRNDTLDIPQTSFDGQEEDHVENHSIVPSPVYGGGLGRGHLSSSHSANTCPPLAPPANRGESRETVSVSRDLIKIKRVADLLGPDFTKNCAPVALSRGGMEVSGLAGLPTYNRPTMAQQFTFVNGRPVRDKLLQGAVRGAYADFLARERFPALALFISLPPEMVDVNVHPAKSEVRFREPSEVRGIIISALRGAISSAGFKASSSVSDAALRAVTPAAHTHNYPHYSGYSQTSLYNYSLPTSALAEGRREVLGQTLFEPSARYAAPEQPEQMAEATFPLGAAKAQVHGTYIIAQNEHGIVVVDQHAAHERLVYERIKKAAAGGRVQSQPLLMPVVVELGAAKAGRIMDIAPRLQSFGLVIEEFGDGSVTVREIPATLSEFDVVAAIKDLAEEAGEFGDGTALEDALAHFSGTLACHTSIRAGRILNADEMNQLLRDMEKTPHSGQCNHGRPTYIELKLKDIERLFGRK